MSDMKNLIHVRRRETPEQAHHFESAGEFLNRIAIEIQQWLRGMALSGASNGKRWVLSATLSNGHTVIVHRMGVQGHSMFKLEGEIDGQACLLLAHHHSVQVLAYYVPRKPQEE